MPRTQLVSASRRRPGRGSCSASALRFLLGCRPTSASFRSLRRRSSPERSAITNNFATFILTPLDGKPVARSDQMLPKTGSRVASTDQKWNDADSGLARGGRAHVPTLIEPATGALRSQYRRRAIGHSGSARRRGQAYRRSYFRQKDARRMGDPDRKSGNPWRGISVERRHLN